MQARSFLPHLGHLFSAITLLLYFHSSTLPRHLLCAVRSRIGRHIFRPGSHGQASEPQGLQSGMKAMNRSQSVVPPPSTSQTAQPDEGKACRECRRRRVVCDGTMPECAVCQRYRRHCLYDKHSRTRLTRKYAGFPLAQELRSCHLRLTRG